MSATYDGWDPRVRGNLDKIAFPELLALLHRRRADGMLMLRQGRVKKIVYLQEGRPVAVKSNLMRECLGQILVREKMISQDEMDHSVVTMKETGRLQGEVLVEMRSISRQNLDYALQQQLHYKLEDVFGWDQGEYQFKEADRPPPRSSIHLEANLDSVILNGVRRKHKNQRLREWVDNRLNRFVVPHHDLLRRSLHMDLTDAEERLILSINGKQTLRQLLSVVSNQVDIAALIYGLKCAGLVKLADITDLETTAVVVKKPKKPEVEDENEVIFDNIDAPQPPVEFDTDSNPGPEDSD